MLTRRRAALFTAAMALGACGPRQALKLGFISGQTGPFSDLGAAGLHSLLQESVVAVLGPMSSAMAAEGALVEQYHDVAGASPAYQAFVQAYHQRFKLRPDYAAVIAFDATIIKAGQFTPLQ